MRISTFKAGRALLVLAALFVASLPSGAVDLISPDPKLQFFDSAGHELSGGLLFTYAAGTTTKTNTYTDNTGGTPNADPIILNTRGETPSGVWLPSSQCYKYVLSPSTDTDPPTNAIWTVDGICGALTANGATFGITVPGELVATPTTQNIGSSIAITKANETKNTVWAGPASGSAAQPTFRALAIADLPFQPRTNLTANATFCVATTGLDTNGGISPNCWLTLQHAWNVLNADYDLRGFNVIVNISAGTYTGFTASGFLVGQFSNTSVNFVGDNTTPANVTIAGTAQSAITAKNGAQFSISGVTLTALNSGVDQGVGIEVYPSGTTVGFNSIAFGFCQVAHMMATGGTIGAAQPGPATYTILGSGSLYHARALQDGYIQLDTATVTLTGTPPFANAFVDASRGGQISALNATFTGAATGVRYNAVLNGVIDSAGGGATFFPGSAGGTTATGGQYN